mmetsp:Transcript_8721/g.12894  ORF Transcript_8721/g.12894 Transcript_8721/m.12894 type:complete len:448 (+) Transcript_8721:19-1362(+)
MKKFSDGDIVWVSYEKSWWPAIVVNEDDNDYEIQNEVFKDKSGDVLYRFIDANDSISFGWGDSENPKSIKLFKENLDLIDQKKSSKRLLKCISKAQGMLGMIKDDKMNDDDVEIEKNPKRKRENDVEDDAGLPTKIKKGSDGNTTKFVVDSNPAPTSISKAKVAEIKSKLVNANKNDRVEDIIKLLRYIHERCIISMSQLKETGLGSTVLKLRKNPNSEISVVAKLLLRNWKSSMNKPKVPTKTPKKVLTNEAQSNTVQEIPKKMPKQSVTVSAEEIANALSQFQSPKSFRNSALTKLTTTFVNKSHLNLKEAVNLTLKIENELWTTSGGNRKPYQTQFKMIIFNMKDENNHEFINNLASGRITPQQVVVMKSKDMASKEKQEMRKRAEKESFRKSSAPKLEATEGMFRCGKCKSEKIHSYQKQTRSADEPMTVFCECTECHNKWKQ